MSTSTPGPWTATASGDIAFSASAGFTPVAWGNDSPLSSNDLRLIAAAPELLETLKAALRGFESFRNYLQTCTVKSPHGLPLKLRDKLSIEEEISNIIAKATGDDPQ